MFARRNLMQSACCLTYTAIGLLGWPSVCHAHPTGLRAGDAWWLEWHFDGIVVINLLILAGLYGRGISRIRSKASKQVLIAPWRVSAFAVSLLCIAFALLSPLDALGNDLGWVHMIQHMVLMVIAAPLLAISAPGLAIVWSIPNAYRSWRSSKLARRTKSIRGRVIRLSWQPSLIWILHAAILWGWHIPAYYQWALVDPLVHDLEHLSFFFVAVLFWRIVLDSRRRPTLNAGLAVIYLFTTSLHAMVLGVLMALSPHPWYPVYEGRAERWGLSALEDQQLAGLIMWMPACLIYAMVAIALFAHWLMTLEDSNGDRMIAAVSTNAH